MVSKMNNKNYLECIEHYLIAITTANKMLDSKIISLEDYKKIEKKIAQKYCIKTNSIYRLHNLINKPCSGNITH